MRYFFDTEFNEEVDPIDLISIGIIADDGREFYAIHDKYHSDEPGEEAEVWKTAHKWVNKNVKTVIKAPEGFKEEDVIIGDYAAIANAVRDFVGYDPFPEFWAYYGHYDWVLMCRLFGTMQDKPDTWPSMCFDLKQYAKHTGMDLPRKFEPVHNALVDARWTKYSHEYIRARWRKNQDVIKWP